MPNSAQVGENPVGRVGAQRGEDGPVDLSVAKSESHLHRAAKLANVYRAFESDPA